MLMGILSLVWLVYHTSDGAPPGRERCGSPGVSSGGGKTSAGGEGVARRVAGGARVCLAPRVTAEQPEPPPRQFPQAQQDRVGRTFWLPAGPPQPPEGRVVV